jgi:hypothetical protein
MAPADAQAGSAWGVSLTCEATAFSSAWTSPTDTQPDSPAALEVEGEPWRGVSAYLERHVHDDKLNVSNRFEVAASSRNDADDQDLKRERPRTRRCRKHPRDARSRSLPRLIA